MLQLSLPTDLKRDTFTLTRTQKQLGVIAFVFALFWWGVGLWLRQTDLPFYIWGDQGWIFLKRTADVFHPYKTAGFFNVPWARVILLPFMTLPFDWGVFAQMAIYFIGLSAVVDKFSNEHASLFRKRITLLIALASPFALDTAIELNIDWMVVIGLLVPPAYSGPFLLIKPQAVIGYIASFAWMTLVRWIIVVLVVVLISLLIWGAWFMDLIASAQFYPLGVAVNVAPMSIISPILSILIGSILLVIAFWRKSPTAGIWGGIFFMPYVASYSILLPFTLLVIRFPRVMAIFTVALWIAVAIVIL